MVIRLAIGAQIGGALRYNEQKVVQKLAHVLGATGFANNDLAARNRSYATSVLENQAKKNANVKKPTLHFSLSLHPSEQVNDDKFKAMAHQFMADMGYQNQPYMVYRHHDTAHPHIHIVTTCVDEAGMKINDAFIKRRTNTARQKLELRFDLIKAEGRGKNKTTEQGQNVSITPGSTAYSSEKRDYLESILKQTFQQGTFSNIDEYRALLKKQRVHTVLHQRTVGRQVVRGISYQFIDEAGKPATPRIKASAIGDWATWKGIEKQISTGGQQQPEQTHRLTYDQYKALATILSEELRHYKKEQHIYYESALIENFPTSALQARLQKVIGGKLAETDVNEAVERFKAYKQSQLPEIIKKEQFAFNWTMETYTKIASEIQGSVQNKRNFYTALSVNLGLDGRITTSSNRHLAYQIEEERLEPILADNGPNLTIPTIYSRGERTVLLLSESKKPYKESYFDVRAEHLELILKPERMRTIHAQLNANYVKRLQEDGPVVGVNQLRYYYQRGIMIDPQQTVKGQTINEPTHRIRYNQAPVDSAVKVGELVEKQINYLNLEHWQKGLSTEAGRYMVALAQLIDQTKDTNGKSNDLTFLRERIHQRDPALTKFSNDELIEVLEKRSLQGKGWIKQTDQEVKQEPNAYMDEYAINAQLLDIRAADVLGYEQTAKYKHVGKGIKKRNKGREL